MENDHTGGVSALKKYMVPLVGIGVVLVLVLGVVWYRASINAQANRKQNTLEGQYDINRAQLSSCITKIRETAGVAQGQVKALDTVLTNVISARYTQPNGPQVAAGSAFSAIVEQYPDLSGLNRNFDRVMIVITGCRDDYQGYQEKLIQMGSEYKSWYEGSMTISAIGPKLPNDKLNITVLGANGEEVPLKGEAALNRMITPILIRDASQAYNTGELKAEDPFNTKGN